MKSEEIKKLVVKSENAVVEFKRAKGVGRDGLSAQTMRRREGEVKNLVKWLKKNRQGTFNRRHC